MDMPVNWEDKFVQCPFYRKTNSGRIVCEGFREGSTINVAFNDRGDKMRFMKTRCESIEGCTQCPIHELLERMYDEQISY
jgi:hypothetical protein